MSEVREAVGVILELPDGSWAVQQRDANAPTDAEKLTLFGGKLDPGETAEEAAIREIREIREETSLKIDELTFSLHCLLTVAEGVHGMTAPFVYYVYKAGISNADFEVFEGKGRVICHPSQLGGRTDVSSVLQFLVEPKMEELYVTQHN